MIARRALSVFLLFTALVGCAAPQAAPRTDIGGLAPLTPEAVAKARAALRGLQVRVEDTGAHYRRGDWGKDWAYNPATKCNTRERVLADQGRGVVVDGQCSPSCPTAACWVSPYDERPTANPSDLDIDHVVSLAEANRSGARGWAREQRESFANDPANLLAVTDTVNEAKGDRDPGRWRPPAASARCRVAVITITIKTDYVLHVDPDERVALEAMLRGC